MNTLAVGQKGRDQYQAKDEKSWDFTLSSLVLVDTVRYADLETLFAETDELCVLDKASSREKYWVGDYFWSLP